LITFCVEDEGISPAGRVVAANRIAAECQITNGRVATPLCVAVERLGTVSRVGVTGCCDPFTITLSLPCGEQKRQNPAA
jgi:hypothetical protein